VKRVSVSAQTQAVMSGKSRTSTFHGGCVVWGLGDGGVCLGRLATAECVRWVQRVFCDAFRLISCPFRISHIELFRVIEQQPGYAAGECILVAREIIVGSTRYYTV
jgi:hypothetical protein